MRSGPVISAWRYRALVLSVLVAAAGYLAISVWTGWVDVRQAFGSIGMTGMAIALALSLVNYGLRFLRWQWYLSIMGNVVPWRSSGRIYLAGFALTTTPGKAGETLRSVLLKNWGVSYAQSLAAFLSERLSDLVAILILSLAGLLSSPWGKEFVVGGIAVVMTVMLLLSRKGWLQFLHVRTANRNKLPIRLLHHGLHILLEAHRCHTSTTVVAATLLSIVAWSAEAFAFYLLLHQLGSDLSLAFSVFVYAVSMLAGALSFLPGGLGGTEAVMISLLLSSGMPGSEAVAATVLIRLATLWFAVLLGMVALASERNRGIAV